MKIALVILFSALIAIAQTNTPPPTETVVNGSVFVVMKNAQNIKLALAPIYVITEKEFEVITQAADPVVEAKIKDYAARYYSLELRMAVGVSRSEKLEMLKDQLEMLEKVNRLRADAYFAAFPEPVVKSDADGRFAFTFYDAETRVIASKSQRVVGDETERYFWAFQFKPTGKVEQIMFSNDNFIEESNMLQSQTAFRKEVNRLKIERIENIKSSIALQNKLAAERRTKQSAANAAGSLRWNQSEADKGNTYGQFRMGERFRDGDGVEKNQAKAIEYFTKAAAQGHKDAKAALEKL